MKHLRTSAGLLAGSFLVAFFVPLLFSPAEPADAYRANDFLRRLELGQSTVMTKGRRTYQLTRVPTVNPQRGRSETTRVYSTVQYMEAHKASTQNQAQWLYARSLQLQDICNREFRSDSLLCFQRNRRLIERRDIAINRANVY